MFLRMRAGMRKGGKQVCEAGAVSGSTGEEPKEALALDRGLRHVMVYGERSSTVRVGTAVEHVDVCVTVQGT